MFGRHGGPGCFRYGGPAPAGPAASRSRPCNRSRLRRPRAGRRWSTVGRIERANHVRQFIFHGGGRVFMLATRRGRRGVGVARARLPATLQAACRKGTVAAKVRDSGRRLVVAR